MLMTLYQRTLIVLYNLDKNISYQGYKVRLTFDKYSDNEVGIFLQITKQQTQITKQQTQITKQQTQITKHQTDIITLKK